MRCSRSWCAVFAVAVSLGPVGGVRAQDEPPAPDPALREYLSGNGLLARGMNELAAKEYRHFLQEHPTHEKAPHARYALAVALSREKQFDAALEQLDTLARLEQFEFAAETGVLRAQCLMAQGKYAEAAGPLNRVIEKHGGSALAPDAAAMLAEVRYRAGAFKEVEPARAMIESRWPESSRRDRAEYFAGLALMSLDQQKEAAARLAQLAEKWPKSPLAGQAALLAAQCAHRARDGAAAMKQYRAVVESGEAKAQPAALLGLATLLREAGKPDEALPLLERVLSDFKESEQATDARLERGRVLFEKGDYGKALRDFDRYAGAPRADAATADFWRARCEAKQGKPQAAAERLASALDAKPGEDLRPLMLLDLASAHLAAGEEEKAGTALEKYLADYPKHAQRPEAMESLATIRHRRGDYPSSLTLCREYLAAYPDHALRARVEFIAAENAFLSGDLKGASAAYEAYLAAHANDANAGLAKFRLGSAAYRAGDAERAKPLFENSAQGAKENPALRPALLYLGDMAYQAGDWAVAERRLREFLAFGDEQAGADDAMLKLGLALRRLGRDADAIEQYDRLLKGFPKSEHRGLASFERARSLLATGKAEEAKEQFRAIADGKDQKLAAMALVQLGITASNAGEGEAAERAFSRAVEIGEEQTRADALLGLGSVLLARGEHQKAADALDRLIREHPKSPRVDEATARRALARARKSPGAEALADLEGALAQKELGAELREALTYERAVCLRQMGRAPEADEAMKAVASGAKGSALRVSAALEVARAQSEAKKFAEAGATLRAVQAEAAKDEVPVPLRESLEYQLGACEFRQEHFKEAAGLFEKFLSEHGKSELAPSAALLAGECRRGLKQPGKASAHFRRALEGTLNDGDRQTALLRLGESLAESQDWGGSGAAFSEHLEKFPKSELSFQARFGKGWALENESKHEEAIAEYRKVTAAHQGPTAARAQFQIGECLFAQGKHDDAARELLKVDILYAYPEWSAAALYEAGRCFEAMGKTAEANAQYVAVREKHGRTRWAQLAAQRLEAKPAGGGGGRSPAKAEHGPD